MLLKPEFVCKFPGDPGSGGLVPLVISVDSTEHRRGHLASRCWGPGPDIRGCSVVHMSPFSTGGLCLTHGSLLRGTRNSCPTRWPEPQTA